MGLVWGPAIYRIPFPRTLEIYGKPFLPPSFGVLGTMTQSDQIISQGSSCSDILTFPGKPTKLTQQGAL